MGFQSGFSVIESILLAKLVSRHVASLVQISGTKFRILKYPRPLGSLSHVKNIFFDSDSPASSVI